MGVQGLLKSLTSILVPNDARGDTAGGTSRNLPPKIGDSVKVTYNIRQFAHMSVAVDASSWLHKAAYSCAERFVESADTGVRDPTCEQTYTRYVISRCREMLAHARLKRIFLVFDGRRCPLKADTNKQRDERRRTNLAEARRLRSIGRKEEAAEKYKSCIRTTEDMARVVAESVEKEWGKYSPDGRSEPLVQVIFSPFEADAQLARLCVDHVADAVITEDSDVLLYSASCGVPFPIIYKLDRENGSCDVVTMDWLLTKKSKSACTQKDTLRRYLPPIDARPGSRQGGTRSNGNSLLSTLRALANYEARESGKGVRMFIQACVLAGTDYSPSRLNGVGLVTAFKLVNENAFRDPGRRFLLVLKNLPRGKINPVGSATPNESDNARPDRITTEKDGIQCYETALAKSEAVFYFHKVLHRRSGQVVPLLPHPTTTSTSDPKFMTIDNSDDDDDAIGTAPFQRIQDRHFPSLARFNNDTSFIGEHNRNVQESEAGPVTSPKPLAVRQVTITPGDLVVPTSSKTSVGCMVENPYKRQKGNCEGSSTPRIEISPFFQSPSIGLGARVACSGTCPGSPSPISNRQNSSVAALDQFYHSEYPIPCDSSWQDDDMIQIVAVKQPGLQPRTQAGEDTNLNCTALDRKVESGDSSIGRTSSLSQHAPLKSPFFSTLRKRVNRPAPWSNDSGWIETRSTRTVTQRNKRTPGLHAIARQRGVAAGSKKRRVASNDLTQTAITNFVQS